MRASDAIKPGRITPAGLGGWRLALAPIVRDASHAGTASHAANARQRLDGKLNTVPSRTPADGQRWVIVLRFV